MNKHKAHFQFLPITSSCCEVKGRIAAEVIEECPRKTEKAGPSILNKTLDFIISNTDSTFEASAPVLWFARDLIMSFGDQGRGFMYLYTSSIS